jgi:hypothetical protein
VTLLAATRLPDGHFMCISDRLNLRESVDPRDWSRSVDGDKWMRVTDQPRLLWAWAGSDLVGLAISHRLEQGGFSDWEALRSELAPRLCSLNGQYVGFGTDCLFAGWIGNVPAMLHLRADGGMSGGTGSPRQEHFVGVGESAADLAWKYGKQHLKAEHTEDNFRSLLKATICEDARLDGFEEWDIRSDVPVVRRQAVPARKSVVG